MDPWDFEPEEPCCPGCGLPYYACTCPAIEEPRTYRQLTEKELRALGVPVPVSTPPVPPDEPPPF